MPFLQFYTTLSKDKVPKDFAKKCANLLTEVLRDKPLDRIVVHVFTDQIIFAGNDPNETSDNAYAVLRSIGRVTADENRNSGQVLGQYVKQSLGIDVKHFKLLFLDIDPIMSFKGGKLLIDEPEYIKKFI